MIGKYSLSLLLLFIGGIFSANSKRPSMAELSLVVEQIGEIMIICEEEPSSCICDDGSTLSHDSNFFTSVLKCKPHSCECPNGLKVKNLDKIKVEEILTMSMFKRVMSLGSFMGSWGEIEHHFQNFCDGETPSSCSCKDGSEITDITSDASSLISCQPVYCKCSNGLSKDVPDKMRYSFLSRMNQICDIKECRCSFSSSAQSMTPPFLSASAFEDCSPHECTCQDGTIKIMPTLPQMEDNLIDAFDVIDESQHHRLSTLCDGKNPESCECKKRDDLLTSFESKKDIRDCYPSTCKCSDGSTKTPPTRRTSFNEVMRYMDLKYGEEETSKLTNFYSRYT